MFRATANTVVGSPQHSPKTSPYTPEPQTGDLDRKYFWDSEYRRGELAKRTQNVIIYIHLDLKPVILVEVLLEQRTSSWKIRQTNPERCHMRLNLKWEVFQRRIQPGKANIVERSSQNSLGASS